jgi:hypothetical protein
LYDFVSLSSDITKPLYTTLPAATPEHINSIWLMSSCHVTHEFQIRYDSGSTRCGSPNLDNRYEDAYL